MVRSIQTVQLSCIKISTISEQTKSSLHLSLFNYEYHRVRLKWFLSLWCIRRKPCTYLLPKLTVSKRTEARFHMTHIIKELYQVRPNWFLSISYVPCKPCIYLVSRLALSPNRPNRAFTLAPWPRSTIGCVQNGFLSYGALGANRAPILHWN
jgi:hypothetical protein